MYEKEKLNFIVKAFNDFKSSLVKWVNSIRNDSTLDILINDKTLKKKRIKSLKVINLTKVIFCLLII